MKKLLLLLLLLLLLDTIPTIANIGVKCYTFCISMNTLTTTAITLPLSTAAITTTATLLN